MKQLFLVYSVMWLPDFEKRVICLQDFGDHLAFEAEVETMVISHQEAGQDTFMQRGCLNQFQM